MGNTVLITGANRGIGLALAREASARGWQVIGTARDPQAATDLAAVPGATVIGLDVTDPAALEAAAARLGPIDLLVCNAGAYQARGGIEDAEYTPEAWQSVLMTNVAGPFFTVRALLPNLKQAPAPKVAVIASVMASSSRAPGRAYIYRASKAAAVNLARNLATDLAAEGVAVGAYHPGWVRTDMGGDSADIDVSESAAGLMDRFAALSPATTGVFEDYRGDPIAF